MEKVKIRGFTIFLRETAIFECGFVMVVQRKVLTCLDNEDVSNAGRQTIETNFSDQIVFICLFMEIKMLERFT